MSRIHSAKVVRRAYQDERRCSQRDAADIARHAGLQPRRIAGHEQALAGKKGEESGRDAVIAQPLVFMVSSAATTTSGHAVDLHSVSRSGALATKVPARPKAPPMARPIAATVSRVVRM